MKCKAYYLPPSNTKKMLFKGMFLVLVQCIITHASMELDSSNNQVLMQLDLVQLPDWGSDVTNQFRSSIASFAESFCKTNRSACTMKTFGEFTANNVVIVQGYPRVVDVNTHMLLYVTLPESTSSDESVLVLRKAILADIITANRIALQHALIIANHEKYEASYRVSYVDNELVLEPSDQTLNTIITPIACGVVALMALLVLVLQLKK